MVMRILLNSLQACVLLLREFCILGFGRGGGRLLGRLLLHWGMLDLCGGIFDWMDNWTYPMITTFLCAIVFYKIWAGEELV